MRELPKNEKAEQSLLACFIMDNRLSYKALELDENMFYKNENRAIFKAIKELLNEKQDIDSITLLNKLKGQVSATYIARTVNALPTTENFRSYLEIVKGCYVKRNLLNIARKTAALACSERNYKDITEWTQKQLIQVSQEKNQELYSAENLAIDVMQQIEKRVQNKGKLPGLSTGFEEIDKKILGLEKSRLYYIAARPAMGKTMLALNIAAEVAKKNPVIFFSLEMDRNAVSNRILSHLSQIDLTKIRTGDLTEGEVNRLAQAADTYSKLKLTIDDTPALTIYELANRARQVKFEEGALGAIFIDYLTMMGGRAESNRILVENNSKGLKSLAKELQCPVVCLAQLSRAPEMRQSKRPILSDLRETGGIEQDADMVAFIYRESYYSPGKDEHVAEFLIGKQRDGEVGTVKLGWNGDKVSFYDITNLEEG